MHTPHLRKALWVALVLSLGFLFTWEAYWRTQSDHYSAHLDDDRYFWAEKRALVETATAEDVVIIGSSRTAFNFNTNVWTEIQGRRPINLSTDGKPGGVFLEDIVENTDFRGTIIMGVTPLLFFTQTTDPFWLDAQKWVTHYHQETYAQKLGHWLSKPLQRRLVMLTATELDFANDLDLKSLIKSLPLKNRIENSFYLPKFGESDEHRNLLMYPSMKTDTAFAATVQRAWLTFLPFLPDHEAVAESIPEIVDYQVGLIQAFTDRGGKLIIIRHKAEAQWNDHSQRILPRAKVWDVLAQQAGVPYYHFEDHPFMQDYTLPDWSHMAADDAIRYTTAMVNRLIEDGHLTLVK